MAEPPSSSSAFSPDLAHDYLAGIILDGQVPSNALDMDVAASVADPENSLRQRASSPPDAILLQRPQRLAGIGGDHVSIDGKSNADPQ